MRTTGRAGRGTRATTACRWRQRVVPRDAGHRGQRVLSRLSGCERVLVALPAVPRTVGAWNARGFGTGLAQENPQVSELASDLRVWTWAILGSNQRPLRCERSAV